MAFLKKRKGDKNTIFKISKETLLHLQAEAVTEANIQYSVSTKTNMELVSILSIYLFFSGEKTHAHSKQLLRESHGG